MQKIKLKDFLFPSLFVTLGVLEIKYSGFREVLFDYHGGHSFVFFLLLLFLWLTWNKIGGAITISLGLMFAYYSISSKSSEEV